MALGEAAALRVRAAALVLLSLLWSAACASQSMEVPGLAPRLAIQLDHPRPVKGLAFSPNGEVVATGGWGTIILWEARSGRLIRRIAGHDPGAQIVRLTFLPDGRLISGSADQTLRIWNVARGQELACLCERHGTIHDLTVLQPDLVLVGTQDGFARLWDLKTKRVIQRFGTGKGAVTAVAVSPDGTRIALGVNGRLLMYPRDRPKEVLEFEAPPKRDRPDYIAMFWGGGSRINSIAFSCDGRRLATGDDGAMVRLWDAHFARHLETYVGHRGGVKAVNFARGDAELLTSDWDGYFMLRDLATGELVWDLKIVSPDSSYGGHNFAISPDETLLLTDAPAIRTLRDGGLVVNLESTVVPLLSVARSPNGDTMLFGSRGGDLFAFDLLAGTMLRSYTGHIGAVNAITISDDSERVLTAAQDRTARVWDVKSGHELARLARFGDQPLSLAVDPEGKRIAVGSISHAIHEFDAASGHGPVAVGGPVGWGLATAYSQDGRLLASGGVDFSVRIWDRQTGRMVHRLEGHSQRVSGLAFIEGSRRLVSASMDQTVVVWDLNTGRREAAYSGVFGPINRLAVSKDAVAIAEAGKVAWVLDRADGAVRCYFRTVSSSINDLAFSPDGRSIAIATSYEAPSIWSATTCTKRATLGEKNHAARAIDFTECGDLIALGDYEGRIDLFQASESEVRIDRRSIKQDRVNWVTSGRIETGLNGLVDLAFVPGRDRLVALGRDGRVRAWRLPSLEPDWEARIARHLVEGAAGFDPIDLSRPSRQVPKIRNEGGGISAQVIGGDGVTLSIGSAEDVQPVFAAGFTGTDPELVFTGELEGSLRAWDWREGQLLWSHLAHGGTVIGIDRILDGESLVSAGTNGTASVWRGLKRTPSCQIEDAAYLNALLVTASDRILLASDEGLSLWEPDCRFVRRWDLGAKVSSVVSLSGGRVAAGTETGGLWILSEDSSEELGYVRAASRKIRRLVLLSGGRDILVLAGDDVIYVWRLDTQSKLLRLGTLAFFRDGSWMATDPLGRFDTNRIDNLRGFQWVFADDPLRPLSPEIFMRDYYEPRLLARILSGETFPKIRPLSNLNRVQPNVKIAAIEPNKAVPGLVDVVVEVASIERSFGEGDKVQTWQSGGCDVRLLRDGQLVGSIPVPKPPSRSGAEEPENTETVLKAWREEKCIDFGPDGTGTATLTFPNIRLPRREGVDTVTFSAYAFNRDRVKSETCSEEFRLPEHSDLMNRRAYIISIGVELYEDPRWNLNFPADDAREMRAELERRLARAGEFREENIISVELVSEERASGTLPQIGATRGNIESVFKLLAGRPVNEVHREKLMDAIGEQTLGQFQAAGPDDLVLIAFSSHGYADKAGNFYLFPYDIGKSADGEIAKLLSRTISSDDLSYWLRDVDAGDLALIVDACHSAAGVEQRGFKPGPMGARGLGQLAYDKGMRVLAATRKDDVAFESAETGLGLLTAALVKDGLIADAADFEPKDNRIELGEWLKYGVKQVPVLYREHVGGEAGLRSDISGDGPLAGDNHFKRDAILVQEERHVQERSLQQPALFDFRRSRAKRDIAIATVQ